MGDHVHVGLSDARLPRTKRRGRSPSYVAYAHVRPALPVRRGPPKAARAHTRCRCASARCAVHARRLRPRPRRHAAAHAHYFPVPLHTSVALESALGMWSPVARCLRAAYVHGRSSSGGLFTGCVLPSLPVTGFLTPHFNTHDWPLAARHACTRQLLTIFSVRLLCMPFSHACRL